MKFEESQTYKNLQTALKEESLAYLKYTIYGNIAKEQGFGYIAKIFEETANNEKEHGEQWLKLLTPDLKIYILTYLMRLKVNTTKMLYV